VTLKTPGMPCSTPLGLTFQCDPQQGLEIFNPAGVDIIGLAFL